MNQLSYICRRVAQSVLPARDEAHWSDKLIRLLSIFFGAALCLIALFLAIFVSPFLMFAQSNWDVVYACAIVVGLLITLLAGVVLIAGARTPTMMKRAFYLILGVHSVAAGIAWGAFILWDPMIMNRYLLLLPCMIFALGCHWIRLGKQREHNGPTEHGRHA